MTCYLTLTLCLYVFYKGRNQRCHNISVPVGKVPHCLSGEAQHKHTKDNTIVHQFKTLKHTCIRIISAYAHARRHVRATCYREHFNALSKWVHKLIYVFLLHGPIFLLRPNQSGTITFSMRCWQVFLQMRSTHSICRKLRLTTIWIRWSSKMPCS